MDWFAARIFFIVLLGFKMCFTSKYSRIPVSSFPFSNSGTSPVTCCGLGGHALRSTRLSLCEDGRWWQWKRKPYVNGLNQRNNIYRNSVILPFIQKKSRKRCSYWNYQWGKKWHGTQVIFFGMGCIFCRTAQHCESPNFQLPLYLRCPGTSQQLTWECSFIRHLVASLNRFLQATIDQDQDISLHFNNLLGINVGK